MDATTQAFVTEIVSRKIAENWLYWVLYLAAVFVAAYFSAYIKKRAENLATKADFDDLREQLRQTTRLTEEIKSEIGHAEWKAREMNLLRRTKLEEYVQQIAKVEGAVGAAVMKAFTGQELEIPSEPMDRLHALTQLYFPQLAVVALPFEAAWRSTASAAGTTFIEIEKAKAASDLALHKQKLDEGSAIYANKYRDTLGLKGKLEAECAKLMQALLQLPSRTED